MARDLGALGESVLPGWAAEIGLICNPSTRDKAGWDFFLESPVTYRVVAAADRPLDIASTALQCLVQVKATDKHNESIQVKLSNWDRLVKSPLPAFFLVLEYDRKLKPQRAYLIHVGKGWIRDVLHRERELGAGAANQLHKKTLALSYSSADRLPSLTGQALWDVIAKIVGDPAEYYRAKDNLLQTVGYEENPTRLTGNLSLSLEPGQTREEALVDFTLGIIPEATVRDLVKVDMRFGIAAPPVRLKEVEDGVAIHSPLGVGSDVVMTVRPGEPRLDTRLALKLHVPPLDALGVDSRFAKLRLLGHGIDVRFHPSNGTGSLKLTLPEGYIYQRLSELRPLARLIRSIAHARDAGRDLHFTLSGNGATASGGFSVRGVTLGLEPVAEVVLQACDIADVCQIDGAQATLESLWRRKAPISVIRDLLCGSKVQMYADVNIDAAEQPGPVAVLPEVLALDFGPHQLYFAIALYGEPEMVRREADRCRVYSTNVGILEQELQIGEHDPGATARVMIEAAAEKLQSFEGTVVIPSNPERLL